MSSPPSPRLVETAILRFLVRQGYATRSQLLERFYRYRGQPVRAGYDLLRRMIKGKLLKAERLSSALGPRSPTVLSATGKGSKWVSHGPRQLKALSGKSLELALQHTEVVLDREAEGWWWVWADEEAGIFEVLIDAQKRRATEDPAVEAFRRSIVRSRPPRPVPGLLPPLDVLYRPGSSEVRLLLPVPSRSSLRRWLPHHNLISLSRLGPLAFELVCPERALADAARSWLKRWIGRSGMDPVVHELPSFRNRPNPSTAPVPANSRYAVAGVYDPLLR